MLANPPQLPLMRRLETITPMAIPARAIANTRIVTKMVVPVTSLPFNLHTENLKRRVHRGAENMRSSFPRITLHLCGLCV
ncbi:hypothetical protein Pr1d_27630 [Bythopirellula goksoeyrii]|uniref:Uncharacterized protein n=1 Tax=Bythopirellula goksoeyrii TaxID=1400387 RepID=A0A5B9Q8Q6_9BACT|nr:hypothetical protein Pr1d_27630 [Bythopirellula goksoeyrii]